MGENEEKKMLEEIVEKMAKEPEKPITLPPNVAKYYEGFSEKDILEKIEKLRDWRQASLTSTSLAIYS